MTDDDETTLIALALGAEHEAARAQFAAPRERLSKDAVLFRRVAAKLAVQSRALKDVTAERDTMTEVGIDCAASLAAAISLLERSPKNAAPSNKMFDQMLDDYRASLERFRRAAQTRGE